MSVAFRSGLSQDDVLICYDAPINHREEGPRMKTAIAKGIATAIVTEVAADTAVIGGVLAARKKAPRGLVAVAGCIAVAGLALLARLIPVIEDEVIETAKEQGWADKLDADGSRDSDYEA